MTTWTEQPAVTEQYLLLEDGGRILLEEPSPGGALLTEESDVPTTWVPQPLPG